MNEGGKGRAWNSNRANFDRNLAVVIGIDRYENSSIRNLSTAVSDASAIADLLEQEYAYKQSDEKPEVIRLFDEAATLQGLRDLFTQTLPEQKLTEGDRLIVYFAGHGLPRSNEDGPEGYLVPHDADPTEPTSFLAMREVSDALSKLECHHLLVILDCCFAGTFRWAGSRKAVPILETIRREHYYHFIRHPAWQVITSSAHDQEALDVARLKEDNRQPVPGLSQLHSPFALALLEGLQPGIDPQRVKADLYPDGVVTAHELFVYLQSRVKELSGEQQAPGIYPLRRDYDKGEFIFTPPGFDPQKLAEALPLNEENNPYRGLKSFDEKHARFFFGRQTLIEDLATRLAKPEQALTVVLGVSGSGKSSLVKAGLMPYLRNQQTEQNTEQWRMLDPMRPGVSPFTSLARTLLPIINDSLLEQLAQVSFLDGIFQPMLKTKAASEKDSDRVALMKVADSWCSATPEARLLLIEDYFTQLGTLGNSQQQKQLKSLHERILAEVEAVSHHLQQEPQFFNRAIATWIQNHPGVHLLLVIDQLEELLTRSQDDSAQRIPDGKRERPNQTEQQDSNQPTEQKEWQKFLEGLSIAIAEHPQTLRLVLTLRSDFEPRFLTSALEPYWKDARFPVRAMTSDELRQVIENPALKQAIYFEELKDDRGNTIGNLVNKLVDEVGQMPGALPLLSFTLSELYVGLYKRWQDNRSTDRTLRFKDYEALGGVAGALTRRATKEYEALDAIHQATMQRVMLRMVTIDGGGVARRRVPEHELVYSSSEENERMKLVVGQLLEARLLVKGQEAGEPYVEPAHDFLVRGWEKLQAWIKKEQEILIIQQRLTAASQEWSNKKQSRFLWNADPRIELLYKLLKSASSQFNQVETDFIQRSFNLKRRNSRLRWTSVATAFIALSGFTISTMIQNLNNQMRGNSTAAINKFDASEELDALTNALETGRQVQELKKWPFLINLSTQIQTADTLQNLIFQIRESNRFRVDKSSVVSENLSQDGKYVVTAQDGGTIKTWDASGREISRFTLPDTIKDWRPTLAVNSKGNLIAIVGENGELKVVSSSGNTVESFKFQNKIDKIFFHPASQQFIVQEGCKLYIRRVLSSQESQLDGCQIDISADSQSLVSIGGDGLARLFDWSGHTLKQWRLPLKQDSVESTIVHFSPNSRRIAIANKYTPTVEIWNTSGKLLSRFATGGSGINSLRFASENLLVTGGEDGAVKIWNVSPEDEHFDTPTEIAQWASFEDSVGELGSSFDGQKILIVTGSKFLARAGAKFRIWDWKRNKISALESNVGNYAMTQNGQKIITTISETAAGSWVTKSMRFWDLSRQRVPQFGGSNQIIFSVDGRYMAIGGISGSVDVYETTEDQYKKLFSVKAQEWVGATCRNGCITLMSFSPDSKYILTGGGTSKGKLWDMSGKAVWENQSDIGYIDSLSFNPNSDMIAIAADLPPSETGVGKSIQLFRVKQMSDSELKVHEPTSFVSNQRDISSLSFTPNGQQLATASSDGSVYLWSLSGVKQKESQHTGEVNAVAFSPNGNLLATSGEDRTLRIWDINGKLKATSREQSGRISNIAFSSDGTYIVSASSDGIIKFWDLNGREIYNTQGSGNWQTAFFNRNLSTIAFLQQNNLGKDITLWQLDLDKLMLQGCNWVKDYLQEQNPDGKEKRSQACHNYRNNIAE